MTADEVRAAVAQIAKCADDYERAHGKEDDLHEAVLQAIADGAENAAELAREALKTADIEFARYCA